MPAIVESDPPITKLDKKSKKHKEKKRPREEEEPAEARNHKRSKSEAPDAAEVGDSQQLNREEKKKNKKSRKLKAAEPDGVEVDTKQADEPQSKKEKKQKKNKDRSKNGLDATIDDVVPESPLKSKKKSKKDKHEVEASVDAVVDDGAIPEAAASEKKKKKRPRRKSANAVEEGVEEDSGVAQAETQAPAKPAKSPTPDSPPSDDFIVDQMDVDSPSVSRAAKSDIRQPSHAPSSPEFPFATQIVSLYVPLFPVGFDQPLTKVAEQHLKPLLNHYSPLLKGVLLDYRHVTLGELPTRADPRNPPTDRTPTLLACKDEYAVGFGWLTAEVYLFVPRRGAWMEGVVNLQSEGHLGVVCWNRFNASIEANRVPQGWKFIDVVQKAEDAKKAMFRNAGKKTNLEEVDGEGDEDFGAAEEEGEDDQENLETSLQQMHATGYWVDAAGKRVAGKLRFRIKNFDVGTAGDHGYISIEGTMLDAEAEKELRLSEKEKERARMAKANPGGMLRRLTRSIPEFSMTNFGKEDEEEDSSKKVELYSGSRPMTPS